MINPEALKFISRQQLVSVSPEDNSARFIEKLLDLLLGLQLLGSRENRAELILFENAPLSGLVVDG